MKSFIIIGFLTISVNLIVSAYQIKRMLLNTTISIVNATYYTQPQQFSVQWNNYTSTCDTNLICTPPQKIFLNFTNSVWNCTQDQSMSNCQNYTQVLTLDANLTNIWVNTSNSIYSSNITVRVLNCSNSLLDQHYCYMSSCLYQISKCQSLLNVSNCTLSNFTLYSTNITVNCSQNNTFLNYQTYCSQQNLSTSNNCTSGNYTLNSTQDYIFQLNTSNAIKNTNTSYFIDVSTQCFQIGSNGTNNCSTRNFTLNKTTNISMDICQIQLGAVAASKIKHQNVSLILNNNSYGNYSYGNYTYGNYSYGNFSYANNSYGNNSYGNYSYANNSYGNYSNGNYSYVNISSVNISSSYNNKSFNSEHSSKSGKSDKSGDSEKSGHSNSGHSGKSDNSGNSGLSGNSAHSENSGESDDSEDQEKKLVMTNITVCNNYIFTCFDNYDVHPAQNQGSINNSNSTLQAFLAPLISLFPYNFYDYYKPDPNFTMTIFNNLTNNSNTLGYCTAGPAKFLNYTINDYNRWKTPKAIKKIAIINSTCTWYNNKVVNATIVKNQTCSQSATSFLCSYSQNKLIIAISWQNHWCGNCTDSTNQVLNQLANRKTACATVAQGKRNQKACNAAYVKFNAAAKKQLNICADL